MNNEKETVTMRTQLNDILLLTSWREIAMTYFKKSSSWLYHKLDGIDSNGGFTPDEARQLKQALYDISDRIRAAADTI